MALSKALPKALMALLFFFVFAMHFLSSAEAAGTSDAGRISFQYRNLFPEGMDWDEKHGRFLLGSMGTGSLFTLLDSGKLELFIRDDDFAGRYTLVGVKVDRKRNRVLATVHNPDGTIPSFGAVVGYDLDTKARVLFSRLDAVGGSSRPVPNDLTVDAAGNVYVTNSADNFIWKLTSSGDASVFTEESLLSSQPLVTPPGDPATPCGLNGIVYHNNDYLLVGQSNTGALFKVHLQDNIPYRVHLVLVRTPQPLAAADGMALRSDGALAVVSSSKAWLLTSTDDWRSATIADELPLNASSFATSVSIRNALKMYVLYSHLPDYMQGISRDDFSIQHMEFPKDAFDDPMWLILVIVLMVVLVLAWRFQMAHFFKEYKRKRL